MDLVGHYLIAARADGRSPKTIDWHRASLKQFTGWREEHGVPDDPESWAPAVLRAYVIYQQDRRNVRTGLPLSGSHVNGLIRSLKAFCRWLHREELVSRDLFAKISVPKPPTLVVPTLSRPEIKQVLLAIRAGTPTEAGRGALPLYARYRGAGQRTVRTRFQGPELRLGHRPGDGQGPKAALCADFTKDDQGDAALRLGREAHERSDLSE